MNPGDCPTCDGPGACPRCGAHPLHRIRVEDQNGAEVMHVYCPCGWESVAPELGEAVVEP